jgi:hypothetical protein
MDILSAKFQTKVHFKNNFLDVNKKCFAALFTNTHVWLSRVSSTLSFFRGRQENSSKIRKRLTRLVIK